MATRLNEYWRQDRYVARDQGSYRVIVADDDPDVLQMLTLALRGYGFDIVQAHDGSEVMELLGGESQAVDTRRPVDVVITDVRMPGPSGMEILDALRRAHWPTAVVLVTAYADGETREQARELGADAFFAKPFDVDELVTAVVNMTPLPPDSRGD